MFVKHFARTDTANLSYLAAELWLYAFFAMTFYKNGSRFTYNL